MGLAEVTDDDSWRVRRDFESILRAMQRANDRQKMLAAHGALLSDERLQLVVEDLRKLKSLEGRVVLHGEEEGGTEAGRILLAARRDRRQTAPRLLHAGNPLRAKPRQVADNSFIRLRRMFTEDGTPRWKSTTWVMPKSCCRIDVTSCMTARRLSQRGIIPIEDGWNGWLGRYQSALVHAVEEITRERDSNLEVEPDRDSRSRY